MTPCIFIGCAIPHENLYSLLADGAGQAGVQRAILIRVGVVQTLLTDRVVSVLAAYHHTLTTWTHSARLALTCQIAHEVAIVAHAHSVVRVGAGGLHAHETRALYTCLTLLCVTERLRERLTWRKKKQKNHQNDKIITTCPSAVNNDPSG